MWHSGQCRRLSQRNARTILLLRGRHGLVARVAIATSHFCVTNPGVCIIRRQVQMWIVGSDRCNLAVTTF